MNVIETDIPGVVVIEPHIFKDERGYFFEAFNEREFAEKVRPVHFVQDNESRSVKGVVRGLHFQKPPYAQSKLVRVVKGEVLDVAVDIRKGSPTFGKYVAVKLTASGWSEEKKQTVSAPGLKEDALKQLIIPTQHSMAIEKYYNAGIRISARDYDELTFSCETIPTENILVILVIIPIIGRF